MAGDKTYITDNQGKIHRATRVHAVTPTNIVWSSNPNDYAVQVLIDGKWHRAILTYDVSGASYFDNVNIDKALIVGADGKNHTALIVSSEAAVTLSSIKTDEHALVDGTTTGETAVCTYTEAWGNIEWEDNVNVYKVIVTGSDGKKHTALLTTGAKGGVQAIVMGVSPLNLPDAVAANIVSLIAYGGTEQRDVPAGYTQCDYVYFLTNAYLTTDIKPTYDGRYEFDFQTTTLGSSGTTTYLGVRPNSSGNGGIRVARISSQVFRIYGFGTYKDSSATVVANTRYKFVWNNQRAVLTTGSTTVFDETYTGTEECNYPLTINGWNSAGSITPGAEGIFVYGFKAWNNQGVLIANYIPVKNANNEVGFYDTVSQSFKAQTSGTIAAGPNATPLPTAPIDIVCNNGVVKYGYLNKNLSYGDLANEGYTSTGGTSTSSTFCGNLWKIKCAESEKYTVSCGNFPDGISGVFINTWKTDGTFNSRQAIAVSTSYTYTIPAGVGWVNFTLYKTGGITIADNSWLQVEKGETATSYVKSEMGVYTDGTVETINVHGKNLFTGQYSQFDSVGGSGTTYQYFKLPKANTTYTISIKAKKNYTGSGQVFLGFTYEGGSATGGTRFVINTSTNLSAGDIASTSNIYNISTYCQYVSLYTKSEATFNTILEYFDVQIEEGSTATDYAPYFNGGTATCEDLLSIGDYTDEQEVVSGAVTRKVGVKVFDGTETITAWPNGNGFFYLENNMKGQTSGVGLSNFAPTVTQTNSYGIRYGTSNNKYIYFCQFQTELGISTVSDFQNWLKTQYENGTPLIIIYPLDTSTTETVTGQPMQTTQGDNIVEITQASMDGLELEVTYMKEA